MVSEGTPMLRADALDDELYEPQTTLTGTELAKVHWAHRDGVSEYGDFQCEADETQNPETDRPAEDGAMVEPKPKRQVPVVISGVFHGMRDEE